MPKVKVSESSKFNNLKNEFASDLICTDGRMLYWGACEKNVGSEKHFQVTKHVNSTKHKQLLAKKHEKNEPNQRQLECLGNKLEHFSLDLCEALLASDITLWKLTNPIFRNFINIPHIMYLTKARCEKLI